MLLRMILIVALLIFPNVSWGDNVLGRIAIDPGHGGYDPGAMRKGTMEKDLNLEISKEIVKILKENNVEVILTRYGDYNHAITGLTRKEAKRYDFERRIDLAKYFSADAFISIHVNVGRRRCMGPETFYFHKSEKGKFLAESIQKELHEIPGINKRYMKTGSYYILTHTTMPCVIVETGFINNPEERELLLKAEYREQLAKAIAGGIITYLKEKDSQVPGNKQKIVN